MDVLRSGKYSDFKVIIPNKTYKLHKSYLCKCEYFATFFESSIPEAEKNEISLEYDDHIFDMFLEYVYSDSKEISITHLHELVSMANYFRFNDLYNRCILSINNVTPEGFADLLIAHVDIVNSMGNVAFACKCNQAFEVILERLNLILDLELLKKIVMCLEGISITPIVKAISTHKHQVELWDHIKDMNFSINRDEYRKLADYNSSMLSLPCVSRCIEAMLQSLSISPRGDIFSKGKSVSVVTDLEFVTNDMDKLSFNKCVKIGEALLFFTVNPYGFIEITTMLASNVGYYVHEANSDTYTFSGSNKFRINPYPNKEGEKHYKLSIIQYK